MGDIKEFTTKGKLEAIFYKVSTGGIKFSVKNFNENCYPSAVPGAAAIILSTAPALTSAYWIIIGNGDRCYIQKNDECLASMSTPQIQLTNEYQEFWVAWNNGSIRLGQGNSTKPLIMEKICEKNLLYIAFAAVDVGSQLKWKIRLPPQIEMPALVKLTGGEPQWVKPGERFPDDAIIGGFEKEILYIIRAKHEGSLTPGKYVPSEGVGYVSWADYAHLKNDFEVLCGCNYMWVPAYKDNIPFGAVLGGYDSRNENLFVGQVKRDKYIIPGKVAPAYKAGFIAFRGREISYPEYNILVVPHANTHGEEKYYFSNFTLRTRNPF